MKIVEDSLYFHIIPENEREKNFFLNNYEKSKKRELKLFMNSYTLNFNEDLPEIILTYNIAINKDFVYKVKEILENQLILEDETLSLEEMKREIEKKRLASGEI